VAAATQNGARLERNLTMAHKQRLVSVALQLRMVQSRIDHRPRTGEAARDVRGTKALEVVEELRESRAGPSLGLNTE